MRKVMLLQMYAAFGQSFVSPVAYLPPHLWQQSYKVVAQISHGKDSLQVPFYSPQPWRLRRTVVVQADSTLLYIEGIAGNLTIIQDGRILLKGRGPWLSVGLIGTGEMLLEIEGEAGGILGGIYLLARQGIQTWAAAPYPSSPLACSSGVGYFRLADTTALSALAQTAGLCWRASFLPSAHVQALFAYRQHRLEVDSSDSKAAPPFSWLSFVPLSAAEHLEAAQKVGFVVLWVLLAAFVSALSGLREAFWRGIFEYAPVGLVETLLGGGWAVGALSLSLLPYTPQVWALIMGFMMMETLVLHSRRAAGWAWQSWLLPAGILSCISLLVPDYEGYILVMLWLVRAGGITRLFPDFAYLWSTEIFFTISIMLT